jgi:hypothetical protein
VCGSWVGERRYPAATLLVSLFWNWDSARCANLVELLVASGHCRSMQWVTDLVYVDADTTVLSVAAEIAKAPSTAYRWGDWASCFGSWGSYGDSADTAQAYRELADDSVAFGPAARCECLDCLQIDCGVGLAFGACCAYR